MRGTTQELLEATFRDAAGVVDSVARIRSCDGLSAVTLRRKAVIVLVLVGLLDAVIPLPILGFLLIYVVLERPAWFRDLVARLYSE